MTTHQIAHDRVHTDRGKPLTDREAEVLQLVADGLSNRDAGLRLGLAAGTVKSHLARIANKLGTGDRTHMVVLAIRAGRVR